MNAVVDATGPAEVLAGARWTNRFQSLGPTFFTSLPPQGMPDPYWVAWSPECARLLGLPEPRPDDDATLRALAGNLVAPGMQPLASVYSGHQFGVWAGQLGDGRALWLGEVDT
ncbi:MAG: protein adenylyltransferase SelO family protein, partial [Rhizobacter sp.]